MSPNLIKELFEQVKTITGKNISIVGSDCEPIAGAHDFPDIKKFIFTESPSHERTSLGVLDHPTLRAIPLYVNNRIEAYVIAELPAEDSRTVQVVTSLSELIIQQFVTSHKPKPDAVDLLLTRVVYRPQTIDELELEEQMAALGYRLDVGRVAVIFELSGFWQNYMQLIGMPLSEKKNLIAVKRNDIENSLASFFTKNQDNVVGYIGNDRFLVFKDLSSTDFNRFSKLLTTHYDDITSSLKNVYIKDVTIGLGTPATSSGSLISSALEALQALEIGRKVKGSGGVYNSNNLGVLPVVLSHSDAQKEKYTNQQLANLTDDELKETLIAFLANNLNLTETAESIGVHRNTVIYRLDKITEILGSDPRFFENAVSLYIALQLNKIYRLKPKI